jgi:alpha 1,2-mannosyltransferase
MDFLSDNGGIDYNDCYCKSFHSQPSTDEDDRLIDVMQIVFNNFEIADMNLWRGEAYTAFFDYLDHNGGFYYEVRLSPLLSNANRTGSN